jgi:hypothetical protein
MPGHVRIRGVTPRRRPRVADRQPRWRDSSRTGVKRRVPGPTLVAAANFQIATALATAGALLSLIAEDLLPLTGPRHFSTVRIGWLAGILAWLFAAIWWRGRLHRRTGTLFYVRVLDTGWADWHTIPIEAARRRRMSLRSVTRWVDLASRTRNGAIDLVDVCAEVATELEAVVNGDRDDTAYTVAPNLMWPVALAVGAELPLVDGLRLLELPGRAGGAAVDGSEVLFRLPRPAETIGEIPPPVPIGTGGTRVGLLLMFSGRGLDAKTVFGRMDVAEYYELKSEFFRPVARQPPGSRLTGAQLAAIAESLPAAVAAVKQAAGDRELVVAAALPKTLAMALGWGLSEGPWRFFTRTHLLHWDEDLDQYRPVLVHPAQTG